MGLDVTNSSLRERLLASLAHPNIASKHWIIRQYDHEVQGGSVIKPLIGPLQRGPSDAAVIRPKLNSWKGVAVACGLAAWCRISRTDWSLLVVMIAIVSILEGLNTALEAAVDLASPRIHPLAKSAKDLAAGMVLIASLASAVLGLLILGPPLWRRLGL